MIFSSSKSILFVFFLGLFVFSFAVSFAVTSTDPTPPPVVRGPACEVATPSLVPLGYWGSNPTLLPCGVVDPATGQKVDCLECGLCGFLMLGQRIIYVMLSVLIYLVAPVRFIWGGFQILVSRGSPEMVSKGRKVIYYTVIGLLIGLGAFLIIQTFLWLLGGAGLTGSERLGWPQINCQRALNQYAP